jgi:molybdopterin-guanine dinucleotide biosynthesis protein A
LLWIAILDPRSSIFGSLPDRHMRFDTARFASAIVPAGGLSRRLGQDKRRLRPWGETGPTLLEHTVQVVARLCQDVVVVLNDPQEWLGLPARLVPDVYRDGGALGGIYSGLLAARYDYALVVACDMPFLNAGLLRTMLDRPRDYDVLVPRSLRPGTTRNALDVEPLHAIYSKACLAPMRVMLERGQRRIAALFTQVRVAYVEPEETRRHDPDGRSFVNVNTAEQMAEATAWLARRGE